MSNIMITIIQCILLIPTIATIGAFWFLVFARITDDVLGKKPTDMEVEERTK